MTINSETLQKPLSEADNPNMKIKLIFIEYSGKKKTQQIFATHYVGFAIPWIFTACNLLEIHGSILLITHKIILEPEVLLILIDKHQFSLSYITSNGLLVLIDKNGPCH